MGLHPYALLENFGLAACIQTIMVGTGTDPTIKHFDIAYSHIEQQQCESASSHISPGAIQHNTLVSAELVLVVELLEIAIWVLIPYRRRLKLAGIDVDGPIDGQLPLNGSVPIAGVHQQSRLGLVEVGLPE